jgi:tetratricopeptide (TPR) repeat protein
MKNRNSGSADEHFEFAAALEEQGKYAEALEEWRRLASDLKRADVLCRLGSLAEELGYLEEAEQAFREAIQVDHNESSPYVALGSMLMDTGENEDAARLFQKALSLEKTEYAYTLLGAAFIRLGKEQEAIENLEAALVVDPEFDEAYYNLGVVKRSKNPTEAERLFLRAIEIDPEYANAHRELGWLLRARDDIPQAEYHLRRAIELTPDDGWARVYLGNLLWRKGDVADAIPEVQMAMTLMPNRAMPFGSLANIYENQERWEEAEKLYERAIEVEPDDAVAHMNFGRMLSKRGDSIRAATQLKIALLLDPDYSTARKLLTGLEESN